ncbi:MsnO8 family LLM class oxidoreductase [Streptomyces erythrochromogenes]|uniref:MsnO8 family LLM class oxidoreductase n=1 Tax=Streptomyces erythrochromogenes TaxID=285574 RepID=UPI0037022732
MTCTLPVSLLEVPGTEAGRSPAETVPGVVRFARRAEELGFHRIWYPEHHGSPWMLDVPPALFIAHVAALTSTITVGSGGALAGNHAPLSLAEQFGALAAFHPGRIDLGIGRGPGTLDKEAARALRRGQPPLTDEEYGESVTELLRRAGDRQDVPEPWLLASSEAGAALAAKRGLPMAFAYHIRPKNAARAVERYRSGFRPSRWSRTPRVMLSIETVCAETEAEAARLGRPIDLVRLEVMSGREKQPLPDPESAAHHVVTAQEQELLRDARDRVQGTPAQVGRRLADIGSRFGADELMLYLPLYDTTSRIRSLELVAGAVSGSALRPAAAAHSPAR